MLKFCLAFLLFTSVISPKIWAQPQLELSNPMAFEMVIIQGVSLSARTFVTKNGKEQGFIEGQEASFNTEDIAIVARAKLVTREYTVWEVLEPGATIPFEKGKIVTMNKAKENIWELIPKQEKITIYKQDFIYRGALGLGLTQGVSMVEAAQVDRSLIQGDILYENLVLDNLSLSFGGRYEREAQALEAATIISDRIYFLFETTYHFPRHESLHDSHLYSTLTFGIGYSRTIVDGETQFGYGLILPGIKLGLEHSLGKRSSFLVEAGLESVSTKEYIIYRGEQDNNEVNGKIGVGLKSYF